ncbi:hypothetical protein [Devosia nitrariae]|uniref:DUF2793 domain-containing protein n=1 Tax=Devosia nitrariae TaxID=2071872 RepID=A0ABQ5W1B1_9HYPH|nr:hypothetical protein [Devosia nitrariae]GLQ53591.1 hypothetical protein GCM10010862_08500 [Devosia nitrariae]
MAVDIVTRAENGARLSIERLDLNFSNTRTALDDLYLKFGAGIRIVSLTATGDGAGLVMDMSDGSTLGPIPFPMTTSRLRGNWLGGGTAYQLRDQVYVDGVGSVVATIAHESGADFATDFDAGRWQMLSADGSDGEDAGAGPVTATFQQLGPVTVGVVGYFTIPMACAAAPQLPMHVRMLSPSTDAVSVIISKIDAAGNLIYLTHGYVEIGETAASIAIDAAFVIGDVIKVEIGATPGSGQADLMATLLLEPAVA